MYAPDIVQFATPVGVMTLIGQGDRLASIRIGTPERISARPSAILHQTRMQIEQWFAGERHAFDIPMETAATARGEALRQGLCAIPFGGTISYGELARSLASSPRAIGQACARNPFPLIVPCHRVTAAAGQLGAYSAGDGPITKAWLLDHERAHAAIAPGLLF